MSQLSDFLSNYMKTKITVIDLANYYPELSYEDFASQIQQLERQQILTAIKSSGTNGKQPLLANAFKINKALIRKNVVQRVKELKKYFHPAIRIEYYLTKTIEELERDLKPLQQLNAYLQNHSFPTMKALAQERSFEIFYDEKYITHNGGKQLLEKVNVWDLLEVWPIADPVSFAINPVRFQDRNPKLLIVENKATFYSLLPALQQSSFTALLYGQGNAITGTINVLPEQLPLNYDSVKFYYFGDIDAEGISIWFKLQQKYDMTPALPFYKACLQKSEAKGKEYQNQNVAAITAFKQHFTEDEATTITNALNNGFYFPQEILKAEQLQDIWRNANWT